MVANGRGPEAVRGQLLQEGVEKGLGVGRYTRGAGTVCGRGGADDR